MQKKVLVFLSVTFGVFPPKTRNKRSSCAVGAQNGGAGEMVENYD